jgi:hypothetical protein
MSPLGLLGPLLMPLLEPPLIPPPVPLLIPEEEPVLPEVEPPLMSLPVLPLMPEEPVLPPLMPLLVPPVDEPGLIEPVPVLCAKEAPASAIAETKIAIVVFFMSAPFPFIGRTRMADAEESTPPEGVPLM